MENKYVLMPVIAELLSPAALDQLREIIRAEIQAKEKESNEARLLSPSETCKLFNPAISKVTLNSWDKAGHLTSYRIGGRVYYKSSEVIAAAKCLKKYKRSI